jgi:zinc finger protein
MRCNILTLHRQIIKSDYASITFLEIDFEIPPKTQQGEITTVEGLLSTAATRLGYEQQHRMETDPTVGLAVAEVISEVIALLLTTVAFLLLAVGYEQY